MKTISAVVLALFLGASKQDVTMDKLDVYPSDDELEAMDLSFYDLAQLEDLGVDTAVELLQNRPDTEFSEKNAKHLEHRIDVWEKKQAEIELMKENMLMTVIGNNEDVFGQIDQAEINLQRVMKFDIDNYLAKQNQIDELALMEEDLAPIESLLEVEDAAPMDDTTVPKRTSWFPNLFQAYYDMTEQFDEFLSAKMDKIRADYKDVSFLQMFICCNLVVFSVAATIGWLFYTPPGSQQRSQTKKLQNDNIVSIPVDFENMKVPKKQIKKQLKSLVKGKKNTKESML